MTRHDCRNPLKRIVQKNSYHLVLGRRSVCAGHASLYTLFGANLIFFLYYSVGLSHLQHSQFWLTFPPLFRGTFVSPAMHMILHDRDACDYNKNLGFMLTIWDRMAETLHIPDDNEQDGLQIKVAEGEQHEMKTVYQLCTTPIKRIASIICGL
jgi:sterol desaturase/sphingolipid hydroxylase (fatty acid hydroxylase superfamily)